MGIKNWKLIGKDEWINKYNKSWIIRIDILRKELGLKNYKYNVFTTAAIPNIPNAPLKGEKYWTTFKTRAKALQWVKKYKKLN